MGTKTNALEFSVLVVVALGTSVIGVQPAVGQSSREESKSQGDDSDDELSADALARRLVEKAGDPYQCEKLAFSFVYEVAGEEKIRRRHVWWPKKGELEVTQGETTVRLRKLHDHELSEFADAPDEHADTWEDIAPESAPETAARAWKWFVNDSYWLLAPSKLFDPGVLRELDEEGRLALTFEDTGLSPSDRYTLTVDRERAVVTEWHYELGSGREGTASWEDYESFGPLHLSTRHVVEGDQRRVVRFEKIEVRAE